MSRMKMLQIGGLLSGAVLVVFGVVAIAMGVDGRSTVRDSLRDEGISFGAAEDPAVAKFASEWAGQQVLTGSQARAMAQIMREHTLSSADPDGDGPKVGLTYSQMGRYKSVSPDGDDGLGGTSDATKAQLDKATGQPVSNPRRDLWVTETALSTALNMSFMAENLALFGIVVGVALLLSGIGFIILAVIALGMVPKTRESTVKASTVTPVAG